MGCGWAYTLLVVTTSLSSEELTVRYEDSVVMVVTIFRDLVDCGVLLRVLLESAMDFKGKGRVETTTYWDDFAGLGSVAKLS